MKKILNHKEIATKGGNMTLSKYGPEHFSKIGQTGAKSKLDKYGPDYFIRLSKAGIAARKAKKAKMLNDLKQSLNKE